MSTVSQSVGFITKNIIHRQAEKQEHFLSMCWFQTDYHKGTTCMNNKNSFSTVQEVIDLLKRLDPRAILTCVPTEHIGIGTPKGEVCEATDNSEWCKATPGHTDPPVATLWFRPESGQQL